MVDLLKYGEVCVREIGAEGKDLAHGRYLDWLMNALAGDEGVAVSELVLSGFLRIVTHPKIFSPPSSLESAFAFTEELRAHPNLSLLAPGSRHWNLFQRLCREGDATGNRIPDAYHAALAVETGCEWISADRGFARYPGLKWRAPLAN